MERAVWARTVEGGAGGEIAVCSLQVCAPGSTPDIHMSKLRKEDVSKVWVEYEVNEEIQGHAWSFGQSQNLNTEP